MTNAIGSWKRASRQREAQRKARNFAHEVSSWTECTTNRCSAGFHRKLKCGINLSLVFFHFCARDAVEAFLRDGLGG